MTQSRSDLEEILRQKDEIHNAMLEFLLKLNSTTRTYRKNAKVISDYLFEFADYVKVELPKSRIEIGIKTDEIKAVEINDETEDYSVSFIDINNLKTTNDTFGHDAGDRCIKTVSQVLGAYSNQYCVARIGGDEFVVIFLNTNLDQIIIIAEEWKKELLKNPIQVNSHSITPSISIGVTQKNQGESFQSTKERADHAMYKAKTGRKGIVTF